MHPSEAVAKLVRIYYELTKWLAPSWLDSSVGRTLYRYRRGHGFVQGQISEYIFAPKGDYCLYYPSNLFRNEAVLKIGEYLTIRLRARVFYEQIVNEAQPS